jgi:phage terminase large subunit-like protein
LDDDERSVFQALTNREREPGERVREFCVVAGRRTAKTSGLMSTAATYISGLVDFSDVLKPAETGTFLCLAQDQRTAKQVLDYVEDNFRRSKILKQRFVRRNSDAIELTNNITVEVRSANSARLRGLTYIGCSADELGHWFSDDTYANPDTAVLGAVRPAMLTTNGMLFMASSPWGRRGVLWDTFNKNFGPKGKPSILVART